MKNRIKMNAEHNIPQRCFNCLTAAGAGMGGNLMLSLYCPNCKTMKTWHGIKDTPCGGYHRKKVET